MQNSNLKLGVNGYPLVVAEKGFKGEDTVESVFPFAVFDKPFDVKRLKYTIIYFSFPLLRQEFSF